MTLYLIRHGESVANVNAPNILGQSSQEPLSIKGEEQATKLGVYLVKNQISFDEVYYSIYKRARDTFEIAMSKYGYSDHQLYGDIGRPSFELREYSPGTMTGHKRSEVLTPEVLSAMDTLGMAFKFPKGESLYEVQQRAVNMLYDKILSVPSDKHRNIAIFSHGLTVKCILQYFMQFDQKMTWRIDIWNTSMSILKFKNGQCFVKGINLTPHLE